MMFDARNNVQCNQSVQFFLFPHAIRMLFFILLFLCKPSSLGTALAYSISLSASPSLPEEAGKLLFEVLGPAAAPGLEQKGIPGPGIPRFLPNSPASQSVPPQGMRPWSKSSPGWRWCRASSASRGSTGLCSHCKWYLAALTQTACLVFCQSLANLLQMIQFDKWK